MEIRHELCSVLLRHGIEHVRVSEREMREWMEAHEHDSVEQLKGSMGQKNCPDPSAFDRAIQPAPYAETCARRADAARGLCGIVLKRCKGPEHRSRPECAMKFLDEYRDAGAAKRFAGAVRQAVTRPWTIMEVCGGKRMRL